MRKSSEIRKFLDSAVTTRRYIDILALRTSRILSTRIR